MFLNFVFHLNWDLVYFLCYMYLKDRYGKIWEERILKQRGNCWFIFLFSKIPALWLYQSNMLVIFCLPLQIHSPPLCPPLSPKRLISMNYIIYTFSLTLLGSANGRQEFGMWEERELRIFIPNPHGLMFDRWKWTYLPVATSPVMWPFFNSSYGH